MSEGYWIFPDGEIYKVRESHETFIRNNFEHANTIPEAMNEGCVCVSWLYDDLSFGFEYLTDEVKDSILWLVWELDPNEVFGSWDQVKTWTQKEFLEEFS